MAELAPGTTFAGHRIEAVAGRGGMGVVYRATHLALDRTVALKVIAPTLIEDASTRQRFLRESKVAASIDHPNVIPVYYTGEEDGIAYIAMRYVPGDDLRSLVRIEGRLEPRRAARIVAQVASALDAAHAASLVHRDVKPANVLLGPDEHVYLSDFGLSKHALSVGGETKSGHWVGTLDYVAPEQIRSERPDARSDVYALGCVLYFALTGGPPYPRDGDEAKLWAHLSEPPPAPSDRVPDLPAGLDGVVARALAKEPGDRFPSVGDLGRAAVAAAEHGEVRERERVVGVGAAAPDETPTETAVGPLPASEAQASEPRRRPPRGAVVAGLAVLAAAVVGAVALATGDDDPDRTAAATPTPTPVATPTVDRPVHVGRRPNSVAVGSGTVFVTNYHQKRLRLIDERTGRLRPQRPTVGIGGRDVAVGLGAAWVAVAREKALFKLDAATGRKRARIELPLSPQTVTVGRDAVWVGLSTKEPEVPDILARIDPRTERVGETYTMGRGIRALVATPTGVWVVHRHVPTVSRFDPRAEQVTRRVSVGESRLGEAAYAAGSVWVTSPLEDTVSRINDKTGGIVTSGVGRRPGAVAARGSEIWVTSFIDHTVRRVDPETTRPVGVPVEVPLNPYALALSPGNLWLTAYGRGEVARVRY
ncbi:MAG TPA: protein kinase [Solirubrobacteraceae bacterium]|nr:protein kinase [Solirubrobacteraceae bacterium]